MPLNLICLLPAALSTGVRISDSGVPMNESGQQDEYIRRIETVRISL